MECVRMSALPFELTARGPVGARWNTDGKTLEVVSAAKSDLFIDPTTTPGQASADLTRLTGEVAGPFQLSARVTVAFQDRFDAGVLVVWVDAAGCRYQSARTLLLAGGEPRSRRCRGPAASRRR
jgi:hypothetical protein